VFRVHLEVQVQLDLSVLQVSGEPAVFRVLQAQLEVPDLSVLLELLVLQGLWARLELLE